MKEVTESKSHFVLIGNMGLQTWFPIKHITINALSQLGFGTHGVVQPFRWSLLLDRRDYGRFLIFLCLCR